MNYARVRQYNDISKETYQRLFDKKISVYQQLNNILHEYKSKVYESSEYSWSPSGQENNHEKAFLDLSYEIKKLVAKNQLVISDEISIKYKEIYKEQSKYFIEHKIMSEDPDSVNPNDYHDMVRNLKKESEKKVLELINVVEKDISKIRQYLSGY